MEYIKYIGRNRVYLGIQRGLKDQVRRMVDGEEQGIHICVFVYKYTHTCMHIYVKYI